jgi:hypothetical protein
MMVAAHGLRKRKKITFSHLVLVIRRNAGIVTRDEHAPA